MQERKTVNRSMLQIAGLLFANPSNPASAALCLIFHRGFRGSKTGRCVSLCPAPGRAVTHSVTWKAAGNSGKGLTGEIDNYWLGGLVFRQWTTQLPDRLLSLASQLPQGYAAKLKFPTHHKLCGSWLASDEARAATPNMRWNQNLQHTTKPVGAGLPAMRPEQPPPICAGTKISNTPQNLWELACQR
ncbi:hypothetical protein EDF87_111170 [Pseudomonas helmanticensis]|uniref:Uncharacterized protein n=1 Tax=Pseudomonas helmanticensis TaxID=1471381 RepID=A0A4R7V7G3_9PSED|nr:hypothetical protein EDF87_111170 [Pseudomonas helmanticensis]